jgi:hypothetical protein
MVVLLRHRHYNEHHYESKLDTWITTLKQYRSAGRMGTPAACRQHGAHTFYPQTAINIDRESRARKSRTRLDARTPQRREDNLVEVTAPFFFFTFTIPYTQRQIASTANPNPSPTRKNSSRTASPTQTNQTQSESHMPCTKQHQPGRASSAS